MRLIFSTSDHLNTDISDESKVLYNVSTPPGTKPITTITKYSSDGLGETMGSIEWPRSSNGGLFRFDGKVIPVNSMFQKRSWSSGLYFVGPDQHRYKWKISRLCMKPAGGDVELVRFHRKNISMKPVHPPCLDVSSSVVSILDFIILTFVYAKWKYIERRRGANAASATNAIIANINATNATIALTTMPPPPAPPCC